MSAGLLPKCRPGGFILLLASVISPSFVKGDLWVTMWEMLINLLKCRPPPGGFVLLLASVISPSFVKGDLWVTMWEMLINLLKCPILQCWGKWKSNPKSVFGDLGQKLTDFPHWPNQHQVSTKSADYCSNPADSRPFRSSALSFPGAKSP